jgi:hypothetical protein
VILLIRVLSRPFPLRNITPKVRELIRLTCLRASDKSSNSFERLNSVSSACAVEEARAGRRDDDPSAPLLISLLFPYLSLSLPVFPTTPLNRPAPWVLGRLGDQAVYLGDGADSRWIIGDLISDQTPIIYLYLPLYRIRGR